jgi:murein L,D-transpeptidase YafK
MKVCVYKSKRELRVLDDQGEIIKTYRVSLGFNPVGPKEKEGDGKTPEGLYQLIKNPGTLHPLGYMVTYPTPEQTTAAHAKGIDPGFDILIHGFSKKTKNQTKDHWKDDWTQGCIAVTDKELLELRDIVPFGTTIEILP